MLEINNISWCFVWFYAHKDYLCHTTRSNCNEMISIQPVLHNKKQYLDLLLLADEQESMIDRYLERGEMFVLSEDGSIRASCVVTREAEDVLR